MTGISVRSVNEIFLSIRERLPVNVKSILIYEVPDTRIIEVLVYRVPNSFGTANLHF